MKSLLLDSLWWRLVLAGVALAVIWLAYAMVV